MFTFFQLGTLFLKQQGTVRFVQRLEERGLTTCGHLWYILVFGFRIFRQLWCYLSLQDDRCHHCLPVLYSLDSLWSSVTVLPRLVFWPLVSFVSFTVLSLSIFGSVFQKFIVLADVLCVQDQLCVSSKQLLFVHSRNDLLR